MSTESQTIAEFLKSLAGDLYEYNPQYCAALAKSAEHVERQQARIAELERQAAIGRRAVEVLKGIELVVGYGGCPACPHCAEVTPGHADDCELSAILRDATNNGMGVES